MKEGQVDRVGQVGKVQPRQLGIVCGAIIAVLGIAQVFAQDGEWPMYSGSYSSQRFSPLAQITAQNVAHLRPVWAYQPTGTGSLETTPLFANGVLYGTSGPTSVYALDVKSGRPLWEWTRPIAASVLNLGFPRVNRGVAILDNTVYVGTLDGYLVALDAKAGIERWTVHVGENPTGHAITAAPLVVDDKVIVGISGGEAGIRGYLDAYDAKSGKQLWRFWTVPSPGEPGSASWPGDSWVHGGGATWLTGSYDPQLKLLYWGTGNPGPDWNGDSRLGDNLYTSRRRDWKGKVVVSVHAARRSRLGRESDSGARRRRVRRPAPIAGRDGEPQRVLLRAGSQDGRVSPRRAVRQTDLGARTRRNRSAHRHSRNESIRKGDAGISEPAGSDQLGEPLV